MPDHDYSILVVARKREQTRLLRTSLELMEQDFRITEVRSGEEADLEFTLGKTFDLLITDLQLGGMSGKELLEHALHRQPDIRIIVTADDVEQAHYELNGDEFDTILPKPLDAGELSRAVRLSLFGEAEPAYDEDGIEKSTAQPLVVASDATSVDDEFGPIPSVDIGAIKTLLEPQIGYLGAMGLAFANRKGDSLLRLGNIPNDLRFSELLIFMARNLSNSGTIATYIGPVPSTTVHYYDGTDYDLFTISVGVHFFVTLVFPGDSQGKLGEVMRFRRKVIWLVIDVIGVDEALGRAAETVQQQRVEFATGPLPSLEGMEDEDEFDREIFLDENGQPLGALAEARLRQKLKEEAENAPLEDLDIDVFTFDDEEEGEAGPLALDDSELDALFEEEEESFDIGEDDFGDLDSFWEEAANELGDIRGDSLSMDEALEMGLLDEEE
jgi:CheY-like chemotaxis protein